LVVRDVTGVRDQWNALLLLALLFLIFVARGSWRIALACGLVPAAILSRQESVLVATAILFAAYFAGRVGLAGMLIPLVLGVALLVPFLVSNEHHYGDAFYASNVNAARAGPTRI